MPINLIDRVRDREDTVIVPQNAVRIAFWPSTGTTRYLATEGLNGCTGVAIVSVFAGILAHIAPVPPGTTAPIGNQDPGTQNLIDKMQEIITLYNTYKRFFLAAQSWVVAAFYQGRQALPDAILGTAGTPLHSQALRHY